MPATRKRRAIAWILSVPLALLAAGALHLADRLPVARAQLDDRLAEAGGMAGLIDTLLEAPFYSLALAGPTAERVLIVTLIACAAVWALAAAAAVLIRRRGSLRLLRAGWVAVFVASAVLAGVAFGAGTAAGDAYKELFPDADDAAYRTFLFRWHWLRWPLAACLLAAGMLLISARSRTLSLYHAAGDRGTGDAIAESLRTGGRDRRYRRSWLSSALLHWLLFIGLPFLMTMLFRGCDAPRYLVPYGHGKPKVTRVMHVVKRKKKRRKKYILRKDSPLFWERPKLDESKIADEVDKQTQLTHSADRSAVHGKMGAGGGDEGGWPDGVPGGKLRFVRLEYNGADWNDGMVDPTGRTPADVNFLNFLRKEVPLSVARTSEAHPIRKLARYPKGFAPPFVYITGSDRIHCSATERKTLRQYLLDGGMLFADAGTSRWDYHFRVFIQSVLPDKRLIDIADDEEIFQMPYTFPNGAPPLWHHGGFRALGVKHKGRWIVFYHPGDMNDAWKTGRSGMSTEIADASYQMGINVMYYAITRYLEHTRKYRK